MTRKWQEGRVKKEPAGIKRGGKIQKLAAGDIGKQYFDSLKEIGKEWRRQTVELLDVRSKKSYEIFPHP